MSTTYEQVENAKHQGAMPSRLSSHAVVVFLAAFVATLVVALSQGAKPFYFDAGNYYWTLGKTFVKQGDFSLLNFDSPLRGYLLPLIDHGLQGLTIAFGWSPSTSAKIFNALVFSLIGAVLAPRLAEICWPKRRWGVRERLVLMALIIVFWSGYLNFPLSDFPALAVVLLALASVARLDSPGWMLVAGIATGAAIDMRPSYELLIPIMLALVAWGWIEQHGDPHFSYPRRAICFCLLIAGFAAVSVPQSLITHRYFNSWSFVPGTVAHLESLQLTEGLRLQRLGGFVGPGHPPLMVYEDHSGAELLSRQKDHIITGAGQYFDLVVDHPVTMSGVFLRHVINGLDVRYTTPYVEHLDSGSHRWFRLAGFLLVFLALLRILWPAARRSLGTVRWRYIVALALCCLTAIPSAMEPRFMLPIYLLSYMLVLTPGWPNPLKNSAVGARRFRPLAAILLAYALFMGLVLHVASGSHLYFV